MATRYATPTVNAVFQIFQMAIVSTHAILPIACRVVEAGGGGAAVVVTQMGDTMDPGLRSTPQLEPNILRRSMSESPHPMG